MIVYGWTDANLQSSTNKGGLLLLLLRRLPTFELHRGSATGSCAHSMSDIRVVHMNPIYNCIAQTINIINK